MGDCDKGNEFSQGYCYEPCPNTYTGQGPLCYKNCPQGFQDIGTACARPQLERQNPVNPNVLPCPNGLRDDGSNCWSDLNCQYVPNISRTNFILSCTGCGCIRLTKQERLSCNPGFQLINGYCYPKCPNGYTDVGTKCAATCPQGFQSIGLQCIKPTIPRNFGIMRNNGLKQITDDPQKSTLVKRYQIAPNSSPNSQAQNTTVNRIARFGSTQADPIATTTNSIISFFGTTGFVNNWCTGNSLTDDKTIGVIVGLILFILLAIYFFPGFLQNIASGIGQFVGGFFALPAFLTSSTATEAETFALEQKASATEALAQATKTLVEQSAKYDDFLKSSKDDARQLAEQVEDLQRQLAATTQSLGDLAVESQFLKR